MNFIYRGKDKTKQSLQIHNLSEIDMEKSTRKSEGNQC